MNTESTVQGLRVLPTQHSVAEALSRLESLARARGLTVFARIDFSGDAAKAGLTMRPEQLLIFGNPKAGTALMQAAPIAGLDLPLKALVWEDSSGSIWVAYNEAQYLIRRHDLLPALGANLSAVIPIIERAAQ